MARSSPEFSTIRTEGAMLPADILRRIAAGDVEGLRPADYGLPGSMKLNEAISGAWTRARGHWQEFSEARAALGDHDETATVVTRQKWLQPLLEILGFGRLSPGKGQVVEEKSYPIQFVWQQVHAVVDCCPGRPVTNGSVVVPGLQQVESFPNRA